MQEHNFIRSAQRAANSLRPIRFIRQYTRYAEGSVLVEMGETRVLCTASVAPTVPPFLKGKNQGWLTAEYGMLPRATHQRTPREAAQGRQQGRTQEIQRLIGRALRASIDLRALGERTVTVDCDVLQADGGTRTAAINGGWLAVRDAINLLISSGKLTNDPLHTAIAAVSVGLYQGVPVLDLDYTEDSTADADMNVVMNREGQYIEVQGTAEHMAFSRTMLDNLLDLAAEGIRHIIRCQQDVQ